MLSRLFGRKAPRLEQLAHRRILKQDVERMRWTGDGGFVMPKDNPGIRVEPNFVSAAEAKALVKEAEAAAAAHGYEYAGDDRVHTMSAHDGEIKSTSSGVVNNIRVTGRMEKPYEEGVASPPPWSYGDAFDRAELPSSMEMLADRISTSGAFHVGELRDITINGRAKSFFQLDPHVDPAEDGPDVFILSLLSSAVLTFTPPDDVLARLQGKRHQLGPEVGLKSWTTHDIDVLVQPGTLLHFSRAARYDWKHAIRAGLQVEAPNEPPFVCDWWGKNDYLLRRNEQRWSVVMAFGSPAAMQ